MNWLPGVSQLKSTVQLISGDFKGAIETQKDFFQQCPVVSQVTSTLQLATGDVQGAVETQKKCLTTLNNTANSLPVIGQAKAAVHAALGDEEQAEEAMKNSTKTSAVVAGGLGGFMLAGPAGAFAGGMSAAYTVDSIHNK